ncbi:MAG: metal-dependent hydrolase [Natrialbaceae archaeon]|nr:metal-dependent hydrolase [Natrialbaceae archaeon]
MTEAGRPKAVSPVVASMLPPGHLAVAYLCYWAIAQRRFGGRVAPGAAVVVVVASQFPDLIDKPLSWWFGVLPTGRTLAHTLLVLVPLAAIVYWALDTRGRTQIGLAFGVGALSHAFADAAMSVVYREVPTFLLWPVLAVETDGYGTPSILGLLVEAYTKSGLVSSAILLEGGLLVLAAWLWVRDGTPGLPKVSLAPTKVRDR